MGPRGQREKGTSSGLPSRRRKLRGELSGEAKYLDALYSLLLEPMEDEGGFLCKVLIQVVALSRSALGFLVEISEEKRHVVWSDGISTFFVQPDEADLLDTPWAKCIRSGEPMIFNRYPCHAPPLFVGQPTLRRVLAVPVIDKGRVAAVACVANKDEPYDREDAHRLMSFWGAAWSCLTRSRLEKGLREQEEIFRIAVEQAVVGVGLIAPDGFRWANRALEDLSGYTLSQVKAWGPLGFARCIHPDDRDMVIKRHMARMAGAPGLPDMYECRLLRPNGEERWVVISASRVEVSGSPAIAVIVVDNQERHELEAVRRQAFLRVRAILEATALTMCRLVEVRDPYTSGHQRRVADLARAIAHEMAFDPNRIEGVRTAALLHDLGKVALPAEILAKPARLHPSEMQLLREHPRIGHDILKVVEFPWPIYLFVLQHHERLDGSGYPDGAKGDEILMESRILAVADIVEAMASHRPYRPAQGIEAALAEIEREQGKTLDFSVVDACLRLFREKGYSLLL